MADNLLERFGFREGGVSRRSGSRRIPRAELASADLPRESASRSPFGARSAEVVALSIEVLPASFDRKRTRATESEPKDEAGRKLTREERQKHVRDFFHNWKTYAALGVLVADSALGHAPDVVLGPVLLLFGSATIDDFILIWWVKQVSKLESAWRGYVVPEKKCGIETAPYDGTGIPESAVTYAVQNLFMNVDNEGWWKRGVSLATLPLTFIDHLVQGVWKKMGDTVKWIWKLKNDFGIFSDIVKIGQTIVLAPIIAASALPGAVEGAGKWFGKVGDAFKKKKERPTPPNS